MRLLIARHRKSVAGIAVNGRALVPPTHHERSAQGFETGSSNNAPPHGCIPLKRCAEERFRAMPSRILPRCDSSRKSRLRLILFLKRISAQRQLPDLRRHTWLQVPAWRGAPSFPTPQCQRCVHRSCQAGGLGRLRLRLD